MPSKLLIPWFLVVGAVLGDAADLTSRERAIVGAVNQSVAKAGAHFQSGDFEASGMQIRTAIRQIELAAAKGSPALYDALVPSMKRITKAHTLLEFEGITLPPFQRPQRPGGEAAADMSDAEPSAGAGGPAEESAINFTRQVAPLLAARCGRCHLSDAKGGFSMSSFAVLMKGPPEGVVVFPGDTVASRLIETIETGDMPRGGGRVTVEELATLKAWIEGGAKFDGEDPNAPLAADAAPPSAAAPPRPQVVRSSGNETVSFAADVAPLLVENCNGCHIDAMQTRGGLRMDTFAQLLRGGDSGAVVAPGKGDQSLLVRKLRGMVGNRMPAGGRPALSDSSIALIAKWIDEGATLDGASENQPLSVMSRLAWAASASPQQLTERRAELAGEHLRLVNGPTEVPSKQTDHFLVTGPVSAATLELVAEQAEAQMKLAQSVVRGDSGEAYFRGRATVFVLPRRYDYSEFAKMVEGRGVPSGWTSHWQFDGIDAYVSLVAGAGEDAEPIAARLATPIISLAVATRGLSVPRWLAEGVGVATADRGGVSTDRDARSQAQAELIAAVAAMTDAKKFLQAKMTPEQLDRVSAAIASSLLDRTQRRGFDAMLRNLQAGMPFEAAFTRGFGVSPEVFVTNWLQYVRRGG
jgi:mono/diheme cytochrome c family protein